MKALGLELRKVGTMKGLYSEIDMVLKNNNIESGGITFEMQREAAAHALHKMMKVEKYFDICTIQNIMSLCQINISKERLNYYRVFHCVYWNEMLDDTRLRLTALILDDFRQILNPLN